MNRALPPGDRGHRSGTDHGQCRRSGVVPGAFGLVGRASHPPEREKPPRRNPGGQCKQIGWFLAVDRVPALAVLALDGRDGQAHFLTQRSADESAYTVGLPVRRFHDLGQRSAILALQQVKDRLGLAALVSAGGFLRGFGRFGRFLGGGSLLPRLGFLGRNGRATWRTGGLFGGFGLLVRRCGRGGCVFFRIRRHLICSFSGDHRGHDMDHSGALGKQANSGVFRRRRLNGDGWLP